MAQDFECLEKMMAVWNSSDLDEQKRLVDEALEHNCHFADPNHNIVGRTAFLSMVDEVQSRIPGATYTRASRVDVQNNFCRYHWEIHMGDKLVVEGFDVTEINDSGKVVKVLGFFGPLTKDSS